MSNTLLPCPFCGGEARIKSRYIGYGSVGLGARDWYIVECNECRAKSDVYGAEHEAIAAWNRRADHIRDATKMVSNADRIEAAKAFRDGLNEMILAWEQEDKP